MFTDHFQVSKRAGFVVLLAFLSTVSLFADGRGIRISGKVICEGKGVNSVQITDGINIVETDKNGNFNLNVSDESEYIYYSLPSGYNSPVKEGLPSFYEKINRNLKNQTVRFEIEKSKLSQQKHAFIVWADPQVHDMEEFDLLNVVISDVNKTITTFPAEIPVHAICCGDNVFDRPEFFVNYKNALAKVNAPFYQVIGNHDMDYNNRSNELSARSYSAGLGPVYYSFNKGNIHYVVLKDVFYYGYKYHYIGYVDEKQLSWLEKDVQKVKPGSTVVVSLHIPTIFGEAEKTSDYKDQLSDAVMNNKALYQILSPFKTHILAGHSHTQWYTQAAPNISEHVHAAACAAWWQGEICVDGSPKGYTVYQVDGDNLTWYFKGVNLNKNEQFKLYQVGTDAANPEFFVANVYNFDPEWKVEWYENDTLKGMMTRYWGKDPQAATLYKPGRNKKYSWMSAGETHHLFKAKPDRAGDKITVKVTDRFGKVYTKTQ